MNVNAHEPRRNMKSKSGTLDHPQADRRELGNITTYHSDRLLISKQDQPGKICWSPTTSTEMSSQKSVQNSLSNLSIAKQTNLPASTVPFPHENPSYMSNTESSKAKLRSQSEPKQRPMWRPKQKSRRSTSMKGVSVAATEAQDQSTPSCLRHSEQENRNPWIIKLFRSAKQVKDSDADCSGVNVTTCNSNCRKTLDTFEVCCRIWLINSVHDVELQSS